MCATHDAQLTPPLWHFGRATLLLLALVLALLVWTYAAGLGELLVRWGAQPEYGHGYFIPLVSAFLIWEQVASLQSRRVVPSWAAPLVVLIASAMYVAGELSALFLLIQYAFILALLGLSLAVVGWSGTRLLVVPIALMLFAVPLPYFIEAQLTSKLQLLSSQIGVMFIRLWDIPVYLEGNLIDLGDFRMQVVEACSGLAYLYPLLGLGCICAYLFRAPAWKRSLLIFSTLPIAILLNSLRIGITGIMIRYWGTEAAAGFLHDFQGWAVFIGCVVVLLAEMWLLSMVGAHQTAPPMPLAVATNLTSQRQPMSLPFLICIAIVAGVALSSSFVEQRHEVYPQRDSFLNFPLQLGGWTGEHAVLDPELVRTLGLSDYFLGDYMRGTQKVNLYIAYYASQRMGVSPHSPTVCMPGGGWSITNLDSQALNVDTIPKAEAVASALTVKRAVVQKGDTREIMYYWYRARGRSSSNEYVMKWYLLRDALLSNRSDGALIRVRARVLPGQSEAEIDDGLKAFVTSFVPVLSRYLPD